MSEVSSSRTNVSPSWAMPIIGLLLAGGLIWGVAWLQARDYYNRAHVPTAYLAAAKSDAANECVKVEPAKAPACIATKLQIAYQTAHDEQDLVAQQRAAMSTLIAAVTGVFALIVSMIGVYFVKRTLEANLQVIKESATASAAMVEANRIARSIGEAQTRAYLAIEAARLTLTDGLPYVTFTVRNSGQSPAAEANVQMIPHFRYLSDAEPNDRQLKTMDFAISNADAGSLAPGETKPDVYGFFRPHAKHPGDYEEFSSIAIDARREPGISCTFILKWIDVFGVECDATGTITFGEVTTRIENGGVSRAAIGVVTTSLYDTAAWFLRNEAEEKKSPTR